MKSGWLTVLVLGVLSCSANVSVDDDPAPGILLLAPINGETFSSLPIVIAYRIIGVDVIELYCDGNLKERYEQARDHGPAVTVLLTNPQDMGGLYISGMHSIVLAGKLHGVETPVVTRRIDFFMDMPTSAYIDFFLPPLAAPAVHIPAALSLVEETAVASVLLIGNFRAPPGGDESSCLAGQYKRALRKLGVFVHTRQEDLSDAIILESTLMAHKPDLVLYVPELELVHGTSALARLWKLSEGLGIATAVMLPHLHTGFTINASDSMWQAGYLVSADPTALNRWPRHGAVGTNSWQHIWLAPAAAIADDDNDPSLPRAAECFGSLECWSRPREHLIQQGREEQGRGTHAPGGDTGTYMYDVVMLPADARQEHMHAGPVCSEAESAECCATWQHGIGLRRRVAAYLAREYGHRFHHGIKDLRQRALSRLVRSAKVCVYVCVYVCMNE